MQAQWLARFDYYGLVFYRQVRFSMAVENVELMHSKNEINDTEEEDKKRRVNTWKEEQ